jgi:CDP-glycerol glycerophosphotransferase (TagB/SpsB family)
LADGIPEISVIVPVYDVEGYLRACLESVLRQTFTDFEVIAVEDCSTDTSPQILAEIAATDPRIRVISLERNGGLGNARNVGLDAATGRFILFLDSDDWLEDDALEMVHERAEETGADVVMFDYARTYWWGARRRNVLGRHLDDAGTPVLTIDDRPGLADVLNVAWNKLYLRDFIERHAFRFPTGYYEDLPWTYPVLLAAERIAPLDRVLYNYRQRRTGNILRTRDRRHFDVLEQYDRLFQIIAIRDDADRWMPYFYRRMIEHVFTVLGAGDRRVPGEARAEFFHAASALASRLRPSGAAPDDLRRRIRHRLLLADRYHSFRAMRFVSRTARGARQTLGKVKRTAQGLIRRLRSAAARGLYAGYRRLPLDPQLAVFAAYWYRKYEGNPKAISEKLGELRPDIRRVWVLAEEATTPVPADVEVVRPGSLPYYRALARAKYLINNVNFPNVIEKRTGSIHVQTQHGTPLKTMGLDLQEYPMAAKEMSFSDLLARSDRWDFNLSSNRYSTEVWRRGFPCPYESLEYGYPRNDVFFGYTDEDVAAVRTELGVPEGKTVVLYAPTLRDYRRGFESHLDFARLRGALAADFVFLIRGHYLYWRDFDDEDLPTPTDAFTIDVSNHPDVQRLCLAADVLVTDYSSIMFDYANLGRPIVIHADDWPTYQRVRGTYFDITKESPGIVTTSPEEFVDGMRTRAYESPDAGERLAAFRRRFCEFDDGHAAERVVKRVFGEAP